MNTFQLECFLAVANFLNFSKAAKSLNITQPAISHQINALETELGTKLFFRTSKNVRLTQAGHLFIQYAEEILRLSSSSRSRLKQSMEAEPVRFGIGCRNSMELSLLSPVLAQLKKEEPKLLPILRQNPFDSLENLLEEGDIQVMFSYRESIPKRASYRELLLRPVVCVCAKEHPLASFSSLTVRQLSQAGPMSACRTPVYPPGLFAFQNQVAGGRGLDQLIFCDNLSISYTLVLSGIVFAIMADLPQARIPGLRYIPIPEFPPLSFGVVSFPEERHPLLGRFFALLKAAVSSGGEG